jgi:hypothetical protein
MDKINLVRNDTRPHLVLSLTDSQDNSVIDLSGAGTVVRLKIRKRGETTLKETLSATKLPGVLNSDGTIDYTNMTAGAGGRCYFQWSESTLDEVGNYEGEIEITFADGVQTVYDLVKFKVRADF